MQGEETHLLMPEVAEGLAGLGVAALLVVEHMAVVLVVSIPALFHMEETAQFA